MLKNVSIWTILKHQHPSEWFFFLTIPNKIHKVLMIYARQSINLKHVKNKNSKEKSLRVESYFRVELKLLM